MNSLVSICIPTYQRPVFLEQALNSCIKQNYADIQILVSDDSHDKITEQIIARKYAKYNIKYIHNRSPLGQANNINQLFSMADGDRIVLLHDDDMLLPEAIGRLDQAWHQHPNLTVCYGKQIAVDADGTVLEDLTDSANSKFYRSCEYQGLQISEMWAALVQQMPNDGFMILTNAARNVGMSIEESIGSACDYEFGLRLASLYQGFCYTDYFTAYYRLSPESITDRGLDVHYTYNILKSLTLPPALEAIRARRLNHLAPVAVTRWLRAGKNQSAARVYFSKSYQLKDRLTRKGIAQLLMLTLPKPILTKVL